LPSSVTVALGANRTVLSFTNSWRMIILVGQFLSPRPAALSSKRQSLNHASPLIPLWNHGEGQHFQVFGTKSAEFLPRDDLGITGLHLVGHVFCDQLDELWHSS
jgi:hypothetical protein